MNISIELILSTTSALGLSIISYFLKRAHTEVDDLKEDVAQLKEEKATHQIKLDTMRESYEYKLSNLERSFKSELENLAASNKKDLAHMEQMISSHFTNFAEKIGDSVRRLEQSIEKLSK